MEASRLASLAGENAPPSSFGPVGILLDTTVVPSIEQKTPSKARKRSKNDPLLITIGRFVTRDTNRYLTEWQMMVMLVSADESDESL